MKFRMNIRRIQRARTATAVEVCQDDWRSIAWAVKRAFRPDGTDAWTCVSFRSECETVHPRLPLWRTAAGQGVTYPPGRAAACPVPLLTPRARPIGRVRPHTPCIRPSGRSHTPDCNTKHVWEPCLFTDNLSFYASGYGFFFFLHDYIFFPLSKQSN